MSDSFQYPLPAQNGAPEVRSDGHTSSTSSSSEYTTESTDWSALQQAYPYPSPLTQMPAPYDNAVMASGPVTAPPMSSFPVPFFSPVGTLDSIPLTPWTGQQSQPAAYDTSFPSSASGSLTSSISSYFTLPTPIYPSPRSSTSHAHTHPYRRPVDLMVAPPSASGMKHVFHPSPPSASYALDLHHRPISQQMSSEWALGASAIGEGKAPRFRPTKEQLDILIAAYNENKNPDAQAREMLAKRLGPDIRTKTLQIWFQNRRSKARAREREASLPRPSSGGRDRSRYSPDVGALQTLVHSINPSTVIIPLSVLSISSWTRFLTPGNMSSPDLGASVLLVDTQRRLCFYVVHMKSTFRISLSIDPSSISNVGWMDGTGDAVAITFDIVPGMAEFAAWQKVSLAGEEDWQSVGDFTGGEAGRGGRCEMTGTREVLQPIYNLLRNAMRADRPAPSTFHSWRYPLSASTEAVSSDVAGESDTSDANLKRSGHIRTRSSSAPQLSVGVPPLNDMPTVAITTADMISPSSLWSMSTAAPTPNLEASSEADFMRHFGICATPISAAVHSPTHRQQSVNVRSFSALGLTDCEHENFVNGRSIVEDDSGPGI